MKRETKKGLLYIWSGIVSTNFWLVIGLKVTIVPWPVVALSFVQGFQQITHGFEVMLKEADPAAARIFGKIANAIFIISMLLSIPAIISLFRLASSLR